MGTLTTGDPNSLLAYTSPPTKRIVDATLAYVAGTTMRTAYLLAGTALGLTVERQRTNEIRNNSMQGVSAGSPGTLPTNWLVAGATGLTRTVVGSGTANGIDYVDIKFAGTTGDASGTSISAENNAQIVAATGETWTNSAFLALVGGSITNISQVRLTLQERTSGGSFVADNVGSDIKSSLSATLQRFSNTATLSGGVTVARVVPRVTVNASSGVAVDFTLRIGWQTCVKMAYSLTPIRTTSAAVTQASDDITLATSAIQFSATAGFVSLEAVTAAGTGLTQPLFQIDDGTANNRIRVERDSSGNVRFIVTAASSEVCNRDMGSVGNSTSFKLAVSWSANDFAASINGGAASLDTGGAIPIGLTTMRLGGDTGTDRWDGNIKKIKHLPRKASSASSYAELLAAAA